MNIIKDLWPEIKKGKVHPCICKFTGEPYWAIPRMRGADPDLLFWIDDSNKDMVFSDKPLNPMIVDGKLHIMPGKFWQKNGLRWFKPKTNKPPHILVRVEWGYPPYGDTRGLEYETVLPSAKYAKRWVHPSGNCGVNWYILRADYSMEDMINDTVEEEDE